jgi:hypothetical protein
LLELGKLILADSLDKLVRVSHDLRYQVVLVVVLKVVDFLEVFVVLLCNSFDICDEGLILQVEAPVLSVIVNSWLELWSLLLLNVR